MRQVQCIFWLSLAVFMAYCSLLVWVVGAIFGVTLFPIPTFPLNRLALLAASLALIGAATSLRLAFTTHLTTRRILSRDFPLSCYIGALLTYALLPDRQWWILTAGFALLSLLASLGNTSHDRGEAP